MLHTAPNHVKCLALSASRRTVTSCIHQLASCTPKFVKSALKPYFIKSVEEVFRDHLVTTVHFQSVFWDQHFNNPNLPCQIAYRHYLVLGFYNGIVEVWLVHDQLSPHKTKESLSSRSKFPYMTKELCLKVQHRLAPHVCLIDDIPSAPRCRIAVCPVHPSSSSSSLSRPPGPAPSEIPSCPPTLRHDSSTIHIHTCFHRERSSPTSVSDRSQCTHVLHQPFKIVGLRSSMCRYHHPPGFKSSLIVLTACQIRVFDGHQFELRFCISQFQTMMIPAFWQWVVSSPSNQSTDDKILGPVVAVGQRWLIYQKAFDTSSQDHPSCFNHVSTPPSVRSHHPHPENPFFDSADPISHKNLLQHQSIEPGSPASDTQSHGRTPTFQRFLSAVPQVFKAASSYAYRGRALASELVIPRTLDGVALPHGGKLTIVDLLTGLTLGHVQIHPYDTPISLSPPHLGALHSTTQCVDVHDGSWCLSHVQTNRVESKSPRPSDSKTNSYSTPLMSSLNFDHTGLTLFCTEYTGRCVFVCRFLSHPPHELQGHTCFILKRGDTAGEIVAVNCMPTSSQGNCALVISSRGSGHLYSLPPYVHLTSLQMTWPRKGGPDHPPLMSLVYPCSLATRHRLLQFNQSHDVDHQAMSTSHIYLSSRHHHSDGQWTMPYDQNLPQILTSTGRRSFLTTTTSDVSHLHPAWKATFIYEPTLDPPWILMTVSLDGVIELWTTERYHDPVNSAPQSANIDLNRFHSQEYTFVRSKILSIRDLHQFSPPAMEMQHDPSSFHTRFHPRQNLPPNKSQEDNDPAQDMVAWTRRVEPWTCTASCPVVTYTLRSISSSQTCLVKISTLKSPDTLVSFSFNDILRNGNDFIASEEEEDQEEKEEEEEEEEKVSPPSCDETDHKDHTLFSTAPLPRVPSWNLDTYVQFQYQ